MGRQRRVKSTHLSIELNGRLFDADMQKVVHDVTQKRIRELGDLALDLARSSWGDKQRYVATIGRFPSSDKLYTIVRSRHYGRPFGIDRSRAGGPILSTWLERGTRGGVKRSKAYGRWRRVGSAVNAIDQQGWFADPIADELN